METTSTIPKIKTTKGPGASSSFFFSPPPHPTPPALFVTEKYFSQSVGPLTKNPLDFKLEIDKNITINCCAAIIELLHFYLMFRLGDSECEGGELCHS